MSPPPRPRDTAELTRAHRNYDEAIKVMQRATQVPRKKVSYHDESAPPQQRLHKSMKLWSYFIDLEESIGTVESTKAAYEKVFDLKIANAQVVINCANFLEENQYWEESFKVYERGVELFSYPIAFEIWNTYLTKFLKRYGGDKIERARDLFEQALDECPPKFAKPLYLLYGHMEEEHGLAKRAMAVYDRATRAVELKDRMEVRRPSAVLMHERLTLHCRCTRTTLPRRPKTLACQRRGRSTSVRSRSCRTSRRPRCACALRRSSASWARLTARAPSMRTRVNFATHARAPTFGRRGTSLRSRRAQKTPSAR